MKIKDELRSNGWKRNIFELVTGAVSEFSAAVLFLAVSVFLSGFMQGVTNEYVLLICALGGIGGMLVHAMITGWVSRIGTVFRIAVILTCILIIISEDAVTGLCLAAGIIFSWILFQKNQKAGNWCGNLMKGLALFILLIRFQQKACSLSSTILILFLVVQQAMEGGNHGEKETAAVWMVFSAACIGEAETALPVQTWIPAAGCFLPAVYGSVSDHLPEKVWKAVHAVLWILMAALMLRQNGYVTLIALLFCLISVFAVPVLFHTERSRSVMRIAVEGLAFLVTGAILVWLYDYGRLSSAQSLLAMAEMYASLLLSSDFRRNE